MTGLRMAGVSYGPLSHLELSLAPGAEGWLHGPSGSGKTLTLYLASGLLRPRAGTVLVAGEAPGPGRVGMLFQNPDYQLLAPTVAEDVGLNAASSAGIEAALAATGCAPWAEAAVRSLSPGQRRRAALAGVLAAEAPLVLLDAPMAGLEPDEAAALWSGIRDFAGERDMAVLATGPAPPNAHAHNAWEVTQWNRQAPGPYRPSSIP